MAKNIIPIIIQMKKIKQFLFSFYTEEVEEVMLNQMLFISSIFVNLLEIIIRFVIQMLIYWV